MNVTVQTYSGYKANERPCSFELDGQPYQVIQLLDRWYGPHADYFKVRAEDQNLYILRYDSRQDDWSLESFRQAGQHSNDLSSVHFSRISRL
jgi:hypothetical protein